MIHGWSIYVANWVDYYDQQGLLCYPSRQVPVGREGTLWPSLDKVGTCERESDSSPSLPASQYFQQFLPQLAQDFPATPIWTFDYESSRDIRINGDALAQELIDLAQSQEVGSFVLVGHSMGGLVARAAVQSLMKRNRADLVRHIITLGTPHTGTAVVNALFAKQWAVGVPTTGGRELEDGISRTESTPLTEFAGAIAPGASGHVLMLTTQGIWCAWDVATCRPSDGVVPTWSALAWSGQPAVTSMPVWEDYDHLQLASGKASPIASDAYYQSVRQEIANALLKPPIGSAAITDDFSSTLARWIQATPLGSWTIDADGHLVGEYDIACGSIGCTQSDLLLRDDLQPGDRDWDASVRFSSVRYPYSSAYDLTFAIATFSLWASPTDKEALSIGYTVRNVPMPTTLSTVQVDQQHYYPWSRTETVPEQSVPAWRPGDWNTATLQKRGLKYTLLLNGTVVHTFTSQLTQPPKLGLHIYGKMLVDDFSLTPLP